MKKYLTISISVLMTAIMLASCASTPVEQPEGAVVPVETAEATVTTLEEAQADANSGWLNAMGSIDGLDVKSYRLRGEGPDGARFGWIDVTGSKVALSDIRRGEWDLYAQAIGEDGNVVASGHLKTFLSDSTPVGTLFLSEKEGVGSITCDFGWTTTQVLYPTIDLFVMSEDGEFMAREAAEITIDENGHAVWHVDSFPAGSYIVRAILKDEGEVVSGIAAALRVLDGKESVGDCRFVIGKLSTVYGIDFQNVPVDTVHGSINLAGGVLSYASEDNSLKYSWFLDGSLVPEFKNLRDIDLVTLELPKGFYRFDVIVSNPAGFTSINTSSAFIYSDGEGNFMSVTEEEADSNKGDIPEGYTEFLTKDAPVTEDIENIVIDNGTTEAIQIAIADAGDAGDELEEILFYVPAQTALDMIDTAKEEALAKEMSEEEMWQSVVAKLQALVDSGVLTEGRTLNETVGETVPAEAVETVENVEVVDQVIED